MAELFELMMNPFLIALYVIQCIIGYFLVMKKMPLRRWTCIIPFLAEREMSKVLFRRLRTFYRPFIIAVVFLTSAFYLGPQVAMGRIFFFLFTLRHSLKYCVKQVTCAVSVNGRNCYRLAET